jgi:hypothetical protein
MRGRTSRLLYALVLVGCGSSGNVTVEGALDASAGVDGGAAGTSGGGGGGGSSSIGPNFDAGGCASDHAVCAVNNDCCSGNCSSGACEPLNTMCKTAGNACTSNGDCCSKLCRDGACFLGSSFCTQTGDVCANAADCCGGTCNIAPSAVLGTCGAPPTGSTYCNGGVDGTVCDGCNDCCSRLCAPYGPSGVKVCQPASGCHVNGDVCRKDGDCCGAAGTGLPGDGNVTCEIAAGQAVGICRNPMGCNPQGDVCHYKDYACSNSSARNDCCGAPGNSGACQLDALGVPRCSGLGGTCRNPGETCSSAADCCNRVPCVADASGVLGCVTPGDAGPTCAPQGGACTINGDCCVGTMCNRPLGSISGTCGPYTPPPSDAGIPADDAGGSSGSYDGGTTCALYGQSCRFSSDCCGGVPCTGPAGICNGQDGCICVTPIR